MDVIDARTDRSGATAAQRRHDIVGTAIEMFAERGYEGSSTREIADAVGLKQGHLYYYFPAKQDLLFTVVDDLHQCFLDGLDAWPRGFDGVDELWAVLVGHVRTVCERRAQVLVAYESVRFLGPERRDQIIDKRDRYERAIASLVAARLPSSDVGSAAMVTKAVLGVVNWIYQWYSESGPLSPDQVATQFAHAAFALVKHPPSTAQPDSSIPH